MNARYKALEMLMMAPDVWYSSATSGTADKTAVDETGERKPQNASTNKMPRFLHIENRSKISSPASAYGTSTATSGPETWLGRI